MSPDEMLNSIEAANAASVNEYLWEFVDPSIDVPPPNYVGSIDAAVGLVQRTLPGWSWRVATCCVSDDAWVQPDFNCPIHGERLKRELDESTDWVELTDVDLRPSGRPAMALCMSLLMALDAVARTSQDKGEPTNG